MEEKSETFLFYSVKAVHSGNVIYFPLFVKYDILWYPACLNRDKPPTKWEKKSEKKKKLRENIE